MYITEIQIRDLVNFQGDHKVSFPVTEEGIPNDLYVLVGQNNSGKTSLLQLAQSCTDTGYFERHWKNINLSKRKPSLEQPSSDQLSEEQPSSEQPSSEQLSEEQPNGIVICKMKDANKKDVTAAFYKTSNCGVYAWAKPDEENVPCFTFMKLTRGETVPLYSVEPKGEGLPVGGFSVDLDYMTKKVRAALRNRWNTKKELGLDYLPWEGMSQPSVIQSGSESIREGVIEAWGILGPDTKEDVIKFIQRIGYEHYEVSTIETGVMVITDTNTGLEFDINRLPDGHQYLWRMAIQMSLCCLPNENTKCLIVDEPTRSMHPSLVHHLSAEMKEYCEEHELQFIITSHSSAVVRALRLSNVFLATRLQDGTTNIRAAVDRESLKEAEIYLKEAEKNLKEIVDKRMEDILFSRLVMVVEGEGDRRLLSMLLSRMSRMKQDGLRKVLEQVSNQSTTKQRLSTFRSLLRDVTVVTAGGTGDIANVMKRLEFLGIPCFMVVDGDFVWPREAQRKNDRPSVNDVMGVKRVQALFGTCDILRDEPAFEMIKTLFAKGFQVGRVEGKKIEGRLGSVTDTHDKHKDKCKTCKPCCQERSDKYITAGSVTGTRFQAVMECAFMIELTKAAREDLTVKEILKGFAQLFQDWFRLFTWRHQKDFDLESFVKPFIKRNQQLNDDHGNKSKEDLKGLLCYGFAEKEMTTLVDEMVGGKITSDLKDFLDFLESRILPYYQNHRKVRKLELIDSSIEIWRTLEVKCKLQDEEDERHLENARSES